MSALGGLSRRERQIMEILYARSEATVLQVTNEISDPPTPMAIRRLLHILVEKGHAKKRLVGREVVYAPRHPKAKAGTSALQRVIETFFSGSIEDALAAHLISRKEKISEHEHKRLIQLIEESRGKKG